MGENSDGSVAPETARLVLVVEDEFLIAMELEAILTGAGYQVLGPAATVGTALFLLEDKCPNAAVLDVNLGGERVTPVARALMTRNIPFVVASAYWPIDLANEPLLSSAVNLGKPTSAACLLKEMSRLLAPSKGSHQAC
jgi:two-component system, response regulator PdtaR